MIAIEEITADDERRCTRMLPRAYGISSEQKAKRFTIWGIFVILLGFTLWKLDFNPVRILQGIKDLGWMMPMLFPPSHGGWFWDFMKGMGETLAMAFLGTLFGTLIALPLGFLGAKNVVGNPLLHWLLRRSLDFVRGINTLIWALMFVHVVGLGPFAGIMAITISDAATLAKLFAEGVENIDKTQVEGSRSTGANPLQLIRYAFIPQIMPVLLSNALYFFESNVRSASILGVLGAGGIGMQLYDRIRIMNWDEVSFIVIMILITVAIIDVISRRLRQRIVANPGYRP